MTNPGACIFHFHCASERAGSREHTMFASLGGLRVCPDILCDRCQRETGPINAPLANDLSGIAAAIGVNNTHRGPIEAVVVDATTGAEYRLSGGMKIAYPTAREVRNELDGATRKRAMFCSTQKQRDDYIHKVRAEKKDFDVTSNERRPMQFVRPVVITPHFGGDAAFRAIGHLALNFLTLYFPEVARDKGLESFKRFVLEGAPRGRIALDYGWQDSRIANAFRFGHRIAVGVRNDGDAVAGVSLYGIYDVTMTFGSVAASRGRMRVVDVDPIAKRSPDDWCEHDEEPCTILPSEMAVEAAFAGAQQRLVLFQRQLQDHFWERDAGSITESVNAVRSVEESARPQTLTEALGRCRQRILNATVNVASGLRQHAKDTGGPAAPLLEAFLSMAIEEENHDLSPRSEALLAMIRDDIADHMLIELADGPIAAARVREHVEGRLARAAAMRAFVDVIEGLLDEMQGPPTA